MKVDIEVFYVRHGQTDANAQEVMAGGGWDIPLNEVGENQALVATEILNRELEHIAHIHVSTMTRAQQTAKVIHEDFPQAKIVHSENLIEWKVGQWEQAPWDQIKDQFLDDPNPPGGETHEEFKKRIRDGFVACLQTDGPRLIVAHGGVWWYLLKMLGIQPFMAENCTPYRLWKSGENWFAKRL